MHLDQYREKPHMKKKMEVFCIDSIFDELFPICRSIAGPGIRESFSILQKYMPLDIKAIATGVRLFDWTAPKEWQLHRATLHGPDKKIILDTEISNLHILNFSVPFKGVVDLNELQNHLYSIPNLPDAIPYVTSYYAPNWGFCIADNQRKKLLPGKYEVEIKTEIQDGYLNYATCDLPGDSAQTILISSYLCHPSLANNELSGPLAMLLIYQKLRQLERRRYSYKFLLAPETIGSIAFLAMEGSKLRDQLLGGMVLTCLGGPESKISFKLSRSDWVGAPTVMDRFARSMARLDSENFSLREFDPTEGSDERQFCSPIVDWPVIQAAKTVYGCYPQYHNSLDDKEFMSIRSVQSSAECLFAFLKILECGDLKLTNQLQGGEPQLGRRGLYPNINGPRTDDFSNDTVYDGRRLLNAILNILSLSDGRHTLIEIADKLNISPIELIPAFEQLVINQLISAGN